MINAWVSIFCPWPSVSTNGLALIIDRLNILGDDAPISLGLHAHMHHEFRAENALGEAGEILDFGGEIKLPQRQCAAQAVLFGKCAS